MESRIETENKLSRKSAILPGDLDDSCSDLCSLDTLRDFLQHSFFHLFFIVHVRHPLGDFWTPVITGRGALPPFTVPIIMRVPG